METTAKKIAEIATSTIQQASNAKEVATADTSKKSDIMAELMGKDSTKVTVTKAKY